MNLFKRIGISLAALSLALVPISSDARIVYPQVQQSGSVTANDIAIFTANNTIGSGATTSIVTTGTLTAGKFIPTSSVAPTNGMYLSAANTLAFASNSTLALSLNSSQKATFAGAASITGDFDIATNKFTVASASGNTVIAGTVTGGTYNKVTITAPASAATLTIADGKTLTASNSLTFTGTDSTSFAFPSTSGTVATIAGTQTLTNKTLTDPVLGGGARVTAQTDVSNSTTLTAVTGLSTSLTAGGTYIIEAYIPATAGASGGIKAAFDTSDTLSATSISFNGMNYNGTTLNANTTVTALGSSVGGATAVTTLVVLRGTIVVNAAGTLVVKIAQNASDGTATSALVNGWMRATRIN